MDIWDHLCMQPFGAQAARYLCENGNLFVHNRTYQRKDIASRLAQEFRKRGGDPHTANSHVTRALKKLLKDGALPFRRIGHGVYAFDGEGDEYEAVAEQPIDEMYNPMGNFSPEREYGDGPCEIYAWYLPLYRDSSNGNCWPIKVGYAGPEGLKRRLEDFATNLPERPCYLMRLGCNDETEARNRERLLHHYFRERDDKVIDNLAGKEWFNTNPDELDAAIAALFPRAHRAAGG